MDRLRWTLALGALAAVGVALAPSPHRPTAPSAARAPQAAAPAAPTPPHAATPQAAVDREPAVFAPVVAPPLRRLPVRPMHCTMPPPLGRFTVTISTAVREDACGAAVEALTEAMDTSVDHCGLYHAVWTCFVDQAKPLARARARTYEDFALLLPRFESHDGFETALALWDADPRGREVISDLFGPGTAADTLYRFLELEIAAIEGLAAEYARGSASPAAIDAWARREAVVAWHRAGPVWDTLEHHGDTGTLVERLAKVAEGPTPPAVQAARRDRRHTP